MLAAKSENIRKIKLLIPTLFSFDLPSDKKEMFLSKLQFYCSSSDFYLPSANVLKMERLYIESFIGYNLCRKYNSVAMFVVDIVATRFRTHTYL